MSRANCQFTGTGGQYFATVLIHLFLLSLITFGIYSPWAWVRIFRLKASHTTINGKPVTFTGTGGQLLLLVLVQGLLTFITFGIYGPWAICKFFSWKAQNTLVDGRPSRFEGSGGGLFLFYLIHLLLLPLLTFGLYYLYGLFRFYGWKEERMRYGGEKTSFGAGFGGFLKVTIVTYILNAFTFGLFTPWGLCMLFRWQVNGLAVGPEPQVEHFPPLKTNLVAAGLLIVVPWALVALVLYPFINQFLNLQRLSSQMARVQPGPLKMRKTYKVPPKPSASVPRALPKKPVAGPAPQRAPAPTRPAPGPSRPSALPPGFDLEMKKLNNLIKLGSKDADAFYNRGWLYAQKGDLQQAERDYTQAIELNPEHGDAYYNRGLAYVKMKRYAEAVNDFTQAIRLNPRAYDAYCNRGNAYHHLGKYDLALRDYNTALRINPGDSDLFYNRGIVYLAKGLRPKAIADFRKAASMGHNAARKYLGMSPRRPGNLPSPPRSSHAGWTMDVSRAKIPRALASGKIHGQDFVVEEAKLENGILTLRQGKDFFPERALTIFLFLKKGEKLEGRTYHISKDHGFGAPHVHMKWREAGSKVPQTKIFMKDYAMRLHFDRKQNGAVPGRVFVSLPDELRSFVAGTFLAKAK